MSGKIIIFNKPILSIETLESGIKIIKCDRTINSIIDRMVAQTWKI
jgi:hypothetical protein